MRALCCIVGPTASASAELHELHKPPGSPGASKPIFSLQETLLSRGSLCTALSLGSMLLSDTLQGALTAPLLSKILADSMLIVRSGALLSISLLILIPEMNSIFFSGKLTSISRNTFIPKIKGADRELVIGITNISLHITLPSGPQIFPFSLPRIGMHLPLASTTLLL